MQFLLYTFLYLSIGIICSRLSDNVTVATISYAMYAVVLLIYYQRGREKSKEDTSPKQLVFAIPLLVFTIANLTGITFGGYANLALLTICAAIEELLFRGFLYQAMSKHSGIFYTIASSLIFCIYHGAGDASVMELVCSFSFSLALSSYMYKYKSILPCIIAHAMTNLTSHSAPHSSLLLSCCAVCIIYSAVILKANSRKQRES